MSARGVALTSRALRPWMLSTETPPVPQHVADTVETMVELHKRAERDVPRHQRSIEASMAFLGHSVTVYAIVAGVIGWLVLNITLAETHHSPPDPPPFNGLQLAASVGALVMATMIWSTQSRQRQPSEERARLELQLSILTEQKLAKVISLVEELRRDMPNVANRVDPLAEAMTHAVDPHAVADALKHSIEGALDPPLDE